MFKKSYFLAILVLFLVFAFPLNIKALPKQNILPLTQQLGEKYSNLCFYLNRYQKCLYKVTTDQKVVALTVDDGPDPRYTPEILDLLKEKRTPATFFLVGQKAQKYPYLVHRELIEGHELGNHTFSHPVLTAINNGEIISEHNEGRRLIKQVSGIETKYFRPPRGQLDKALYEAAVNNGEIIIMWTLAVENRRTPTPQLMAKRIINKVTPGTIILLHDGILDRTRSVKTLPIIIDGLKNKGYRFVTISELIRLQENQKI